MSPEFYKLIHLIGLICLFISIGGFLAYEGDPSRKVKLVGMLHGIGLLLLVVSGFGMQAKLQYGFPFWIILKVVLWLALGALLTLAKKGTLSPKNAILLGLLLGAVATYAGLFGKFGFQIPAVG